jgi:hypothetical protein
MLIPAQNPTLNTKNKVEREASADHKVLIIPFEPKLYMSEIDRFINAETNLTARQIKFRFSDGLGEQLYKAFKAAKYNAIDLLEDTVKYKKDLNNLYQYLTYDYVKVPDQQNYKVPKKEKEEKKIDKGQLIVETDGEKRFMNARLINPKLLSTLNSKYKTDVFLFINQLDLKASGSKDPLELGAGNPNRRIVVHYTVLTMDGREINSGTAEEDFDPELNNPKKIIEKHFSKVAAAIVQRTQRALTVVK